MENPRIATGRQAPKDLATFTELSGFLNENHIKLIPREENNKENLINYHIEQNNGDDAFFIVDLGELLERYKQWVTLLPRIKPFCAVKACPDPMVLKTLAVLGCDFYCSSKTEIVQVTNIDVPSNRILFVNPIKDPQHIKFARSINVDLMTFDNEVELYKIKLYHPYAKLLVRIEVENSGYSTKMSSKFGCPISEVRSLLEKARSLDLEVVGVTFYIGNKNSELEAFSKAIENCKKVFEIATALGMNMYYLNIGGGFPGGASNSLLTFEDIARTVNEAIDTHFANMEDLKIIAEPGRYFSTKSHTLVFNVIGKRKGPEDLKNPSFEYYMNDGIYGSFSCLIFDGVIPDISCLNNKPNDKKYKSTLYGPTCDNMDVITRSAELPELGLGDWCFVENFGAYTQVTSSEFGGFGMKENYYLFTYN